MDRVGSERVSPVSCPMLDAIYDDTINCNFTVSSVITFVSCNVDRETIFLPFFSLEEEEEARNSNVSSRNLYVRFIYTLYETVK